MTARIPVGVIGAGSLGYHHIRILKDLPDVDFRGFHDSDSARADTVASELGVRAHTSVDALIDECEALTIVVPTPAHYAVAKVALERGKHLLIEKPLTATLDEADKLLEIARKQKVIIQTGHVERFNRAILAAMPYVTQPRFIESDRLAPFNPRGSDVAVVLDLMIHDIDLVRELVGAHISDLSAVGVPVLTPMVDIANARIAFEGGAVANITASRVSRERMRKLRLFQPNGYISLDLAAGNGEFYQLKKGFDVAEVAKGPLALEAFVERIPLEGPDEQPLKLELISFLGTVRGKHEVAVSGEDGREALAIALRIVREIEKGLPTVARSSGRTSA